MTAILILSHFSCSTEQNKLNRKIDTVEFHYIMWACECANWAIQDIITNYREKSKLSKHCAFVQPADSTLILSDTLGYNGDIVQFTGHYYLDKAYPKEYIKGEQQVEKNPIFRYTSYRIIKSNYRQSLADQIDSAKYFLDKGALGKRTEILDVLYAAIMCTCPQWFETKNANDTPNVEQFYLEPASHKIVSANKLYDGTNLPLRISVTGKFYLKKGYPANYFPTKGDPQPANVFRYDKIKIIQKGNKALLKNGT